MYEWSPIEHVCRMWLILCKTIVYIRRPKLTFEFRKMKNSCENVKHGFNNGLRIITGSPHGSPHGSFVCDISKNCPRYRPSNIIDPIPNTTNMVYCLL